MIKVTDEMIADARDASVALNGHCSTYLETKASIEAVLKIIERDYVPRYGTVRLIVPTEFLGSEARMHVVRDMAFDRAKIMGGMIEDIETFECEPAFDTYNTTLTWRMRRD